MDIADVPVGGLQVDISAYSAIKQFVLSQNGF